MSWSDQVARCSKWSQDFFFLRRLNKSCIFFEVGMLNVFCYQTKLFLSRPLMCFHNETCLAGLWSCTDFIKPEACEVMQHCSLSQDGNWLKPCLSLLACCVVGYTDTVHCRTIPFTYVFRLNSSWTNVDKIILLGLFENYQGTEWSEKQQLSNSRPLLFFHQQRAHLHHLFILFFTA